MRRYKELLDRAVETYLGDEHGALSGAKRYALTGGGRTRGMLTLAWCEYFGGKAEDTLSFALAVELVQAMSLVHDDLPCMDDAPMRRGKPSLHRKFGEAVAVLTGDALLADAFALTVELTPRAGASVGARTVLASACSRMAEGQAAELMGDTDWMRIASGKTAALFEAACELGAIAAGGSICDRDKARTYGHSLGLAYQLVDDLADADGAASTPEAREWARERACERLNVCAVQGDGEAAKWLRALPNTLREEVSGV